ncbi:helix-turn-helix domain-containing protein [Actinokineospora soli]|uniref:Helix-turn-helix domain-containing protein n=1 Tax=Actinokineospora soli TaxID=1048753 RepID=A0ABW2TRC4_9PSEU
MVELRRELGRRLAACRKAAGMSQASVAEKVFVDRTRLAHLENGRGQADEEFWRSVDAVLGAGGLLVRADLEFRAAKRVRERQWREAELAAVAEEMDGWRANGLLGVLAVNNGVASSAVEWVDQHGGLAPGTSRRRVAEWLRDGSRARLSVEVGARSRVGRSRIAEELGKFYGLADGGYRPFGAFVGDVEVPTSVAVRNDWVGVSLPLDAEHDQVRLVNAPRQGVELRGRGLDHALRRVAESEIGSVRLTDQPLYRLLSLDLVDGVIRGEVGMGSFLEYALTVDLLESELVDAIAAGRPVRADALPLRSRYLPDWAAVTDVGERLTAGGVLSLFAVARPADPFRGPADFAVLVQQRSPHVVNGSGRLAVVPKGFHGPLTDYRADARISATLLRELEEELFGRGDVDSTRDQQRAAVPMHPSRLSEPMRWLLDGQRMRMECTGFGLNLVSGNYEFACLTVVEDEEFWARFGGAVEANWEATGLRVYSTLDREFVAELMRDESWSNEGLFAFLLGLRRLGEIGGKRVDLPSIRWTTASGR